MVVKTAQLKKFLVKDLKAVIKEHKLGKVSKLKKPQLLALILNAPNSKDIMSKLSPKLKVKKKFSAKQLAAQQRFKEMARARKTTKPKPSLEKKGMSELLDMALDKGLKMPSTATKAQVITAIQTGKQSLKEFADRVGEVQLTKPVKKEIVKKAKVEIKEVMTDLIEKETDKIGNKKKLKKLGKKAFLNTIFGADASPFNLKQEVKDIVNEASDEQLEIFLSFSKQKKKELLQKRFDTAKSLGGLLKTFIK